MIVFLILILPGIIPAILNFRLNNTMNWRKALISFLPYTICINLIILAGLRIIVTWDLDWFAMSLRFKIKWLLLDIVLAVIIVCITNIRKISGMIIKLFPASLFFTVTYAVFAPNSLFLNNISEFKINYIEIVPVVLFVAIMLWLAINAGAIIFNENNIAYYSAFIFSIALGVYVQSNFLNPRFSPLNGTEIDWSGYTVEGIVSTCFWFLCIFIILGASFRWRNKAEQIMKYAAYFLSAVQMVTLIVLLLTTKLENNVPFVLLKEGELTIGSEENIVIFIIDSLQTSAMEEYLVSDAYMEGMLDDFTFFDNAVSGGADTDVAMPLLLTGTEYDPLQPIDEYSEEIWEDALLYDDMHEYGYDVRIYSDDYSIPGMPAGVAENYASDYTEYSINSYYDFSSQLYKLVNFYVMPQILKERFWTSTSSIMSTIVGDNNIYNALNSNAEFDTNMQEAGALRLDYEKSFRLYHLFGVHRPYQIDEEVEETVDDYVKEQLALRYVMKEIYTYIDYMKKAGVYDSSTIIILGDHGPTEIEKESPEANPAVLIKQPYASHELDRNLAPIHFRNIYATCASVIMEDYSAYGPSVFDITDESDVERLHTIVSLPFFWEMSWYEEKLGREYFRIIVPDNLKGTPEYKIWNPYEINRIEYELGDNIDYIINNSYAEQINYRLYKENETAIASNELSICFNLTNYSGGDLGFHFTYSKVYNNEQNIRIYANGSRVATVTCTENNKGEDNVVIIPENMIDSDTLVLRMVFPNAVTPNQIDRTDTDMRVLSVAFDSMRVE